MTKNEKAIAVCKDVLKHLRWLRIEHGGYLHGSGLEIPPGVTELQKVVPQLQKKCDVCLLGACLISKIRLFDEASCKLFADNCVDQMGLDAQLSSIFDGNTMAYMESAFELIIFRRNRGPDFSEERARGALIFGLRYRDQKARVRAVLKEVIRQGGSWLPEPATWNELDAAHKRWQEASD